MQPSPCNPPIRPPSPEALIVRGVVGVFVSAAGAPYIFDHEGVSQIISDSGETAAA